MAYGYDKKNEVANTVARWRKVAGLTQSELAEVCGVSRKTIAQVESGETNPSIALALGIARELERPVDGLWGHHDGSTDDDGHLVDLPERLTR
jgi:putative transcriptional regulator